jgi:hypothetical protein
MTNKESSKALTYARHTNVRRKTHKQLLAPALHELEAALNQLIDELKELEHYSGVSFGKPMADATIEIATQWALMFVRPFEGGIESVVERKNAAPEEAEHRKYLLFYEEWRESESAPGLTTAELADNLLYDLLTADEREFAYILKVRTGKS